MLYTSVYVPEIHTPLRLLGNLCHGILEDGYNREVKLSGQTPAV